MSLALFAIAFLGFFLIEKKYGIVERLRDDETFRRTKRVVYWLLGITLFLWILSTQFIPVADQMLVQRTAEEIAHGDFSSLQDDAYIGTYPFQLGLVWFSCLLGFVFGFGNYFAFQLVNVFAYIVIFYCLVELGCRIGIGRVGQLCILLLAFMFYPLATMVSFVYGNLIGLALSLSAILFEFRFFECRKLSSAVASAVLISLAIFFKANYQVFLIGMVLTALAHFLKEKKAKTLALVAFCLIGFLLQGAIAMNSARVLSGASLDQGIGSSAYIAMGLHDEQSQSPENWRAPGWYDASTVAKYAEGDFNSEQLKKSSIADICASVRSYLDDPARGARFAAKKFASQWCNPDFQSIWNLCIMQTDIERPMWVKALISAKVQDVARYYLKALQLSVEFLAIACLFRNRRWFLNDGENMILLLIIIGGVMCHMVWEAKAQYAITYYVLLFPFAVRGAQDVARGIQKRFLKSA